MSSNKPIKVTFILPTLFAGGSERIFTFLAQNIDKSQFETTLLVIGKSSEAAYDVTNIDAVFLEKSRVLESIPLLFKYLKNNKQDIVVSVISHLNTVIAYMSLCFPKTKFIARESTILSVDNSFFNHSKRFDPISYLAKKRFDFFDRIICQSQDMFFDLKENYKVREDKLIVINNPITENFEIEKRLPKENKIRLITVGRLSQEKGIPRILEILSKMSVPFHYTLIGSGPEKELIDSLIEKFGLSNQFTHIPYTKKVAQFLRRNDFYLQGSYFEGFPNALLESCTVGTPVIAFNVPGGTKEIVEEGVNGFLVNSEEEFLQRINDTREWDPNAIIESVYKKFSKEKILKEYEGLFKIILKK